MVWFWVVLPSCSSSCAHGLIYPVTIKGRYSWRIWYQCTPHWHYPPLNILGQHHQLPLAWSLGPVCMDNWYCERDYLLASKEKLPWYLWVSHCFIMTGRKKNGPEGVWIFRLLLGSHLNLGAVYEGTSLQQWWSNCYRSSPPTVNNYKIGKWNILSNSLQTLNNRQHWTMSDPWEKEIQEVYQSGRSV